MPCDETAASTAPGEQQLTSTASSRLWPGRAAKSLATATMASYSRSPDRSRTLAEASESCSAWAGGVHVRRAAFRAAQGSDRQPGGPAIFRFRTGLPSRTHAGAGAAALGSPVNCVTWLANTLGEFGITLKAGEVILSGSLVPLEPVKAGDYMRVDIGGIGSASVRFA